MAVFLFIANSSIMIEGGLFATTQSLLITREIGVSAQHIAGMTALQTLIMMVAVTSRLMTVLVKGKIAMLCMYCRWLPHYTVPQVFPVFRTLTFEESTQFCSFLA